METIIVRGVSEEDLAIVHTKKRASKYGYEKLEAGDGVIIRGGTAKMIYQSAHSYAKARGWKVAVRAKPDGSILVARVK